MDVGSKPMVDRVAAAVEDAAGVDEVVAVTSPRTPNTRDHLRGTVDLVEGDGDGYVADLENAVERVETPVLSVAADLPLLTSTVVETVLDLHEAGSTAIYVPVDLKTSLGVSVDVSKEVDGRSVAPSGLNVVAEHGDFSVVLEDPSLAVNVNRRTDLELARELAEEGLPR